MLKSKWDYQFEPKVATPNLFLEKLRESIGCIYVIQQEAATNLYLL